MSREERVARKEANEGLHQISRRYHDGLPIQEIDQILAAAGFDTASAGIYTGYHGTSHEQVGPNTWLSFTWYRMEATGRYEVTAYVS